MMLRVEQGKGGKDRHAMLFLVLLELRHDWYRIARPQGWLFLGQNPANPMTTRQLTRSPERAAYSTCLRHRPRPEMPTAPRPTNKKRSRIPVRAAAVA